MSVLEEVAPEFVAMAPARRFGILPRRDPIHSAPVRDAVARLYAEDIARFGYAPPGR